MAELSGEQRRALWAELMERLSREQQPIAVTKAELRAAVDAVDAWVNANAASLNGAIPQPARGALSTAQKAMILAFVVEKRYVEGV